MNLVVAVVAAVLLLVFAYLAADRRRKLLLWHKYAGLAALFAVLVVAAFFIPDFFPPPEGQPVVVPDGGDGSGAVVVEGVLSARVSECAGQWCFSIDVVDVLEGPDGLADERTLEVRTDRRILLRADRRVKVSGVLQNGHIEAEHTGIYLVDSLGHAVMAEVVGPEQQPEPPGREVEFYGFIAGDWEQCNGEWCAECYVDDVISAEIELPDRVRVRHATPIGLPGTLDIYGTYKNGVVDITWAGVAYGTEDFA